MKVKALSLAWTRNFFKGDSRINPRVVDGLQVRLMGTQNIANGNSGAPLSISKIDELIDAVDGATHLLVSKNMRRKLTAAVRAGIGGDLETTTDEFGRIVQIYGGLPLLIVDYDNEGSQILGYTEASPDGSNLNCTSIYAVNFNPMYLTGIQGAVNGQYGIDVRDLGELEGKPVLRTRVDWYNAIACYHGRSAARLSGITDAAAVG